jgi:integrase
MGNDYAATKVPGVYVRHENGCPASHTCARCRCEPSYRARRRDLGWSPTFKSREQAEEWKSSAAKRAESIPAAEGPTFGELARKWWAGVENGSIGKRKGRKGDGYSETTLADYRKSLFHVLLPEFEHSPAADLDEQCWQGWVDKQSRKGLSRSRIANLLAVVSAAYGWGSKATRRIVPRNPTVAVELPPNDEKPRERVATAEEAALLLDALAPHDRVPYALAFYAGLRRSEIDRLEWADVDLDALSITVRVSKSEAGTLRRVPLAAPLVPILGGIERVGECVCIRSVMSGKLAEAARKRWEAAELEDITLHECRHTYASLLMAAGYNVKELMAYLGHADLATTSRYVKLLPQPQEDNPADRLNAYLAVGSDA